MTKKTKVNSGVLESVHETAADPRRLGFIDKSKMKKYDALCLEPVSEHGSTNVYADLGLGDAEEMTRLGRDVEIMLLSLMHPTRKLS